MKINEEKLFDLIGGRPVVEKVHKIFYDKIYADPWIGLYFKGIDQKTIEDQQTDFMIQSMGGPKNYCGKFPIPAHKHMFITNELFDLRHQLLTDSLKEAGVPDELAQYWLKIDGAFRKGIVKASIDDCQRRFVTDDILNFKKAS